MAHLLKQRIYTNDQEPVEMSEHKTIQLIIAYTTAL